MRPRTVSEIAEITGGERIRGEGEAVVTGVQVDSRKVSAGDLFVAFRGERADGHDFVGAAFAAGAAAAMVTREVNAPGPLIRVADPLAALQRLAAEERAGFRGPVVGVTGSNGKTTTKDLLRAVFDGLGPCLATPANLNNELGLPLTLLRRTPEHQSMVLEMGMRGLGQIQALCEIARPTAGIITNIGHSHIELLGSQENIARAKGELLEAIPPDGVAALCGDDPWLRRIASRCRGRVVWYGLADGDARATRIETTGEGTRFLAEVLGERQEVLL
ncbi:MAG: UDP-N-acetylmuramoyl-tripeptide--D-alanyl-D-alanine ligase, partial [Alicyclobacillus sp.]|nr:UDP-N-acetylmuramoyl-tripeptide--D-alanyl-D-alanine ligase [Alicyclobacillus sp.]